MSPGKTAELSGTRPSTSNYRLFTWSRVGKTGWVAFGVLGAAALIAGISVVVNEGASMSDVIWSLLALSVVTAVASYGQTVVVLTGGLDLSIPWTMTMGGVLLTAWSGVTPLEGSEAFVAILALGAGVGLLNGLGVVYLRVPAVVMTLAMNATLQGAVLIFSAGAPTGTAPDFLVSVMNERGLAGIPYSVCFLAVFIAFGTVLLKGTSYGRRVYAVGSNRRASELAGVPSDSIVVSVYIISGLTATLAGALLAGFSQQSFLGMGDQYLLPSIAAVVIGGASVLGGRGSYVGTVAGVLLLTSIGILLSGRSSDATKTVIFGGAILITALAFNRARAE